MTPILYMQWDARWKKSIYSKIMSYNSKGNPVYYDTGQNIGNSGCGTTCAAMVVATLRDKKITPAEASEWSMKHGHRTLNSGTDYGYFVPYFAQYGIWCQHVTPSNLREMSASKSKPYKEKLITALKNGKWAICSMWGTKTTPGNWTKSGHFILAYGIDSNGKVLIRDPNSTDLNRVKGNQSVFLAELKHYWLIDVTDEKEEKGMDYNEWKKCYDKMRADLQDNDASKWSQEARDWAVQEGIVQGSSEGEFNGMWEDVLTREQMAVMLYRFAKLMGKA